MKWTSLLTLVLIGLVAGDDAWKQNQELESQTLTALHELNDQLVITVSNGNRLTLSIRRQSDNLLIGKDSQAEFSEIHQQLPQGWDSDLEENRMERKNEKDRKNYLKEENFNEKKSRSRRNIFIYSPSTSSNDSSPGDNSSSSSSSRNSSQSCDTSDSSSTPSSLSIDSSEDYYQPKLLSLMDAPESPLLPMFAGYKGNPTQNAKQINAIDEALKLIKEIAQDIRNPDDIIKKNTLEKFVILTHLLRTMNAEQIYGMQSYLSVLQDEIDIPQPLLKQFIRFYDPDPKTEWSTWKVFRDAVAEAGTPPTADKVMEWVEEKKIMGEEAVQLIATMGRSIQTPTKELMQRFFQFATNAEVQQQSNVNTTALMTFTEFMNRAQVINQRWDSVYDFGYNDRHNEILTKQVIPYLAKELKQAFKNKDSHKIQVYIRSLGNLGHSQIVTVFEPYLVGKVLITPFQRLAMVVAMDQLAQNYPRLARYVLFNIYRNFGETHPVRCAAVFQLMRAAPTASMLQHMAVFTNVDPSNHVNSAVKSAIKSAARLTQPEKQELAKNAIAAEKFLNENQDEGLYSRSYLSDYAVEEMNLRYNRQYDYIGSPDDFFPNAIFLATERNVAGFKRYNEFYAMVSSIDDLTEILYDEYDDSKLNNQSERPRNTPQHWIKHQEKLRDSDNWSIETIAQMLNIESEAERLEGQLMFNIMNTRRFFAFDNQTIERYTQYARYAANQLQNGQQLHFTKFYDQTPVTISFPLSTGFPFVFTYNRPTLVQTDGEIRVQTNPSLARGNDEQIVLPKSVNMTGEIRMTYSTMVSGKVGFITPFNNQRYTAGYTKKAQVFLPLKIKIYVDLGNNEMTTEIEPLDDKQNTTILHMSNSPYTAHQDILELRPVAESKDFKLSHVLAPQNFDQYSGQNFSGIAFRVQIEHEKRFADLVGLLEQWKRLDMPPDVLFPMATMPHEQFSVDLQIDYQKSTLKSVKITLSLDDDVEDNVGEPKNSKHPEKTEVRDNPKNTANSSSKSPNSQKRRQQFVLHAAAYMTHRNSSDLDIIFKAAGKIELLSDIFAAIAYMYSHKYYI